MTWKTVWKTPCWRVLLPRGEGAGVWIHQLPSVTGGGLSPGAAMPSTSGLALPQGEQRKCAETALGKEGRHEELEGGQCASES